VPSPWQQLAAADQHQQQQPESADEAASALAIAALRALEIEPQLASAWHMPLVLQLVSHSLPAVRWAAAHAAARQLRMGPAALSRLLAQRLTDEELVGCQRRWDAQRAAAELEKARWWLGESSEVGAAAAGGRAEPDAPGTSKAARKRQRRRQAEEEEQQRQQQQQQQQPDSGSGGGGGPALPPSSGFVELCGLEVPSRRAAAGAATAAAAPSARLVRTAGAAAALEAAALALCQRQPLLLEGPPGCGKTEVARELVRATGNAASAFWLHLDDQMDTKSLLGAYTCTPVPGEFAWQPGPLARAVAEGRWVVIEGLDAAPADVAAALAPLLESGSLHVPSRAQVLHAAPGFQLVATVTTAPAAGGSDEAAFGGGGQQDLLGGLWARVQLEAPTDEEQLQILGGTFPELLPILPAALAAAHLTHLAAGHTAPPLGAVGAGPD
jgi:midasin